MTTKRRFTEEETLDENSEPILTNKIRTGLCQDIIEQNKIQRQNQWQCIHKDLCFIVVRYFQFKSNFKKQYNTLENHYNIN